MALWDEEEMADRLINRSNLISRRRVKGKRGARHQLNRRHFVPFTKAADKTTNRRVSAAIELAGNADSPIPILFTLETIACPHSEFPTVDFCGDLQPRRSRD